MSPPPPPLGRRDVWAVVGSWAALSLTTIGVIAAAGGVQRVGYVMAVTGVAVVAWFVVRRVAAAVEMSRWPTGATRATTAHDQAQQTVDTQTMAIESNLRRGLDDPQAFTHRVQPTLRALAEHRLRRAHGVELDVAAARDALGTDLWELLHVPCTRRVPMARLADAIDRIERIA